MSLCLYCCCINCCGGPSSHTDADLPPAEDKAFAVSVVGKADADAFQACQSRGFRGDAAAGKDGEGFQSWVVKGATPEGRTGYFDYNSKFMWLQSQQYGGLRLGARNAEGKLVGVLVAYPPKSVIDHGSCGEMCMFCNICCCKLGCSLGPAMSDPKTTGKAAKTRAETGDKLYKEVGAVRKGHKRYWTLDVVAVDPDHQGQGAGKALMRALCHIVDRDGSALVVEFVGERLAKFYMDHGFTSGRVDHEVEEGGEKLKMTAMVRGSGGGSGNRVAPDSDAPGAMAMERSGDM